MLTGGGESGPSALTETTDAGAGADGVYAITDGALVLASGVLNGWKIEKNGKTATVTEVAADNQCNLSVAMTATFRVGGEIDALHNCLLIYKEIQVGSDFDLKVRVVTASSAVHDNIAIGMWKRETDTSLSNYAKRGPFVGLAMRTGSTTPLSDLKPLALISDGVSTLHLCNQYAWSFATDDERWLRVKKTGSLFNTYYQTSTTDDPDGGTWVELVDSNCAYGSGEVSPHRFDVCGSGAVMGIAVSGLSGTVAFSVERIIATYTPAE